MEDGIARMGQVVFSSSELSDLRALGLGSCIGLCIMDPIAKICSLAHIVLPETNTPSPQEPGKYADTAISYVIKEMVKRGAHTNKLRAAIVGGAHLFSFNSGSDTLDIGKRNIEAVKKQLTLSKIPLIAEEVGGKNGRTVIFDAKTGEVHFKTSGAPEQLLTQLLS